MKSKPAIHSCVEVCNQRPPIHPDFLEIEVHPASDDFRLFERLVNQGIDSRLQGFTLSQFGYRRYDSIGVRAFFHFHRSEVHIIRYRLDEIFDPYLDDLITQWLDIIENHQFE